MRIPYSKIEGINVIDPGKGDNNLNAGIDFYIPSNAVVELDRGDPNLSHTIHLTELPYPENVLPGSERVTQFTIDPQHEALIHSGIIMEIDFGQFGMIANRSGVASKYNCTVGACIIDTFYDGEVCFDIHNIGYNPITFKPNDKIVQLVIAQFISASMINLPKEALYSDMMNIKIRGKSGFGSSGI